MLRNETAFLFLLTSKGNWRLKEGWAEAWLRLGRMCAVHIWLCPIWGDCGLGMTVLFLAPQKWDGGHGAMFLSDWAFLNQLFVLVLFLALIGKEGSLKLSMSLGAEGS